MPEQQFYFLGEPISSAKHIDVDTTLDLDGLKHLVAAHFAIVEPNGIGFQAQDKFLSELSEVVSSSSPVAITIDGHEVRDIPGPQGLPYVGNYLEVYPDHLGNHQRLFDQYGPIFKTTNMGRTVYQTNDPVISAIAFAESDFFSKKINESHPLAGLKTPAAGIFLGDTDTPEWRVAHKFLPPALGPKAVRHYAPTMQKTVEEAYEVFDELDRMQERLLQELIDHGIDENTQITADITDRLDFLDKYIKETQRRHNPSFQPGRTAKVDLILPGGYRLPKDAVLIPALHHIHNNPSLWDNPAHFNPDRWDTEQVKNRHKASPNNLYVRAERRVKWPARTPQNSS
ncbi:hypothetical protein TrVGV298_006156 [Trichoderma virens]|nr:hypothetical protein TrVGV298_006156 [Trichoderma virens]